MHPLRQPSYSTGRFPNSMGDPNYRLGASVQGGGGVELGVEAGAESRGDTELSFVGCCRTCPAESNMSSTCSRSRLRTQRAQANSLPNSAKPAKMVAQPGPGKTNMRIPRNNRLHPTTPTTTFRACFQNQNTQRRGNLRRQRRPHFVRGKGKPGQEVCPEG